MDEWADPWAEEQTGTQAVRSVATKQSILWQDEAGWEDVEKNEADLKINEAPLEKPGDRRPPLQIPQSKHALNASVDSAISFGLVPGDDSDEGLAKEPCKEQSLEPKSPRNASAEPSVASTWSVDSPKASFTEGESAMEASYSRRESKTAPEGGDNRESGFRTEPPQARRASIPRETKQSSVQDPNALDRIIRRSPGQVESLVEKLFDLPVTKPNERLDDPGDVIASASSRRAWYRITRPETLREFNGGDSDDNYARVRWPESRVRQKTLEIVSSWVEDDRASASERRFGWNTRMPGVFSAPARASETDSVDSMSKPSSTFVVSRKSDATTVKRTVDNSPVTPQFNWSTSPVVGDFQVPLQRDGVTAINSPSTQAYVVQRSSQKVANLYAEPPESTTNMEHPSMVNEADEDWGEMVESPTIATLDSKSGEAAPVSDRVLTLWRDPTPTEGPLQSFLGSLPDLSYMMK